MIEEEQYTENERDVKKIKSSLVAISNVRYSFSQVAKNIKISQSKATSNYYKVSISDKAQFFIYRVDFTLENEENLRVDPYSSNSILRVVRKELELGFYLFNGLDNLITTKAIDEKKINELDERGEPTDKPKVIPATFRIKRKGQTVEMKGTVMFRLINKLSHGNCKTVHKQDSLFQMFIKEALKKSFLVAGYKDVGVSICDPRPETTVKNTVVFNGFIPTVTTLKDGYFVSLSFKNKFMRKERVYDSLRTDTEVKKLDSTYFVAGDEFIELNHAEVKSCNISINEETIPESIQRRISLLNLQRSNRSNYLKNKEIKYDWKLDSEIHNMVVILNERLGDSLDDILDNFPSKHKCAKAKEVLVDLFRTSGNASCLNHKFLTKYENLNIVKLKERIEQVFQHFPKNPSLFEEELEEEELEEEEFDHVNDTEEPVVLEDHLVKLNVVNHKQTGRSYSHLMENISDYVTTKRTTYKGVKGNVGRKYKHSQDLEDSDYEPSESESDEEIEED
ncbi:hypothetical protein ABK040_000328 [Willaertia magna]